MKWVLIGHRGVGKSSLLKRLSHYGLKSNVALIDLDEEIARRRKMSVSEIFSKHGESQFRVWEKATFEEVHRENTDYIVSVGAGFDVSSLPRDVHTIWVRRNTDDFGRIFQDRPRLDISVDPLVEFQSRMRVRKENFRKVAEEVYWLPEGQMQGSELEKKIFLDDQLNCGGCLTLLPDHFDSSCSLRSRVLRLNPEMFELRTDLLSLEQISQALRQLPEKKVLLSIRNERPSDQLIQILPKGINWDWPAELGECEYGHPTIISLHELQGPLEEALKKLEVQAGPGTHLKVSPLIDAWEDLEKLYHWQQQKPARRSVLPRSESGRWKWFRLRMKGWQLLNFWKDADGSALDQPSLFEWMSVPSRSILFAAVVGEPINHSWTPIEQKSFFDRWRQPVLAVSILQNEWFKALLVLQRMGLQAAAVTSPLKHLAFQVCDQITNRSKELKSVNTIIRHEGEWMGHNTDWDGFEYLWKEAEIPGSASVAVWGGGGTLKMIQALVPWSNAYSARTGELRDSSDEPEGRYDVVIWAADPQAELPPLEWKPRWVLDLNYREDSRAREYALLSQAQYNGGDIMFRKQAEEQRKFWERFLNGAE